MKVTHKFKIPYDANLYQRLKSIQLEAAQVYNETLKEATLYYRTTKKWLSCYELQENRKGYFSLHSQTVQGIVDKYDDTRKATRILRKNGQNKKYPWKYKKYFCIPFKKSGFDVTNNGIILKYYEPKYSLVNVLKTKPEKRNDFLLNKMDSRVSNHIIIPNLATEDLSNCTYLEIVWNRGYWVHYVVEVMEEKPVIEQHPQKVAGGDMGEIHSVTVATEDKALVVSGRAIRSIQQWRSKCLAELNKKISRCQKHSRQWKKYVRAKINIISKSKKQLEDWIHKTTNEVITFLVKEKVTHFVLGNVCGIEKNTKQRSKTNSKRRQQLSQWNYGKLTQQFKYKTVLKGIHFEQTEESYTSQLCPFCGGKHKTKTRTFYCPIRKMGIHRDVNGAQNIARKQHTMDVQPVTIQFQQPIWLKHHLETSKRMLFSKKYHRVLSV